MSDIWRKHLEIQSARRKVMSEAMREYDETTYIPAMKALTAECAKVGHVKGRYWNNGLGYDWYYCSQCGDRMDVQSTSPSGDEESK